MAAALESQGCDVVKTICLRMFGLVEGCGTALMVTQAVESSASAGTFGYGGGGGAGNRRVHLQMRLSY